MDDPQLSPMSGPRVCGCKGIRSCRLCMATDAQDVFIAPRMTFSYCIHCSKAWQEENTSKQEMCNETSTSQSHENAAALDKPGHWEMKAADLNDDTRSDDTPGVNSFPEELPQSNISVHLEAGPRLGGFSKDASNCSRNASSEDEQPVESFPEESQQLNTSVHPEACPRLGEFSKDASNCNRNASSEDEQLVECFPEESQQLNTSVHPEACPRLGEFSKDASNCNRNASSEDEQLVECFPEESQQLNTSVHPEASPRLDGVSQDVSSCSHNASSEDEQLVECFPEESKQLNTSVHPEASPRLDGVSQDVSSCSHNASSEDEQPVESFPEESQQLNTSVHTEAGPRLDGVSRDESSCSHNATHKIDFEGILILEDFVSEAEEADLDRAIAGTQFVNSQSGRRKQDFGPKVNFKKQKVRIANFTGLPSYSQFLYQRMKAHPHLSDFEPVELCNLEYCQCRGAHIDPHIDDDWLWGERLVTLNLLSESVLTFTLDSAPDVAVRVPLLRRSLIVVAGVARYSWKHSILPGDVVGRRLAMTFRELSKEFRSGGSGGQQGAELLKLALTFSGSAVGS